MFEDDNAVALDFESFYDTKSDYSLSCMPTWKYCADDRFDPYLVSICGKDIFEDEKDRDPNTVHRVLDDGRQLYVGRPERFRGWKNLEGRIVCMHNASFDEVVLLECWKRGILPRLENVRFVCTADLSAFMMVPRNLKGAMKYLFGKEISKDVRTGMDGRHDYELSKKDYDALLAYSGDDAVECHDIWLEYANEWPELERAISEINREATIRGIMLDRQKVVDSVKELERYLADVVCDIPWYPEKAVGSLPALRQAVIARGVEPPKSFKKDDPGFLEWAAKHDDIPFIRARQRAVSISMHLARLRGMLDTVEPNGTSHPVFLYGGSHTLRFSGKSDGAKSSGNLLNLPRKPVLAGDEHVFGGKGVDIRSMYVARPGYKFVIADFAQIEARFMLWLVNDEHMMAAIKDEGNLYGAAAVMMGWCPPHSDIKHTNPDLYRLAKCAVLGLGYGMGAAKFVDSCKSQGLDLPVVPVSEWPEMDRRMQFIIRNVAKIKGDPYSEQNREKVGRLVKALRVVDDWRRANHLIVEKWKEYEAVFKRRVAAGKDTVAFRLPSGRIKRYYNPHLCKEETTEVDENGAEHPSFRIAMKATTVRGNPAAFFTGGNIAENITQATCRDIMAFGAVEIERKHPEWKYVFSVYDEIIFEVPEADADEALKEIEFIMCHGDYIKDWTKGLMLEVEGGVSDHYTK